MKGKGKRIAIIAMSLLTLVALTPVASAFSDIKGTKGEKHIVHLKERGVIKGDSKGKGYYHPQDKLSYAQAAVLLDEAFDLNLDAVKFIKEPKASDYYEKVKDNKWYSQSFIDGYHNGMIFAKDINPNASISREEFAGQLMTQVDRKVDYPLIMMHVGYKDIEEGKEEYKGAIQKLLLLKFEELSDKGKFYPTKAITREDAAIWLDSAVTFVEEQLEAQKNASALQDVKLSITKVNNDVNKATVTATVPHPGYGIAISSIEFEGDTAYVTVKQVNPDPDKMYPQVISDVSVDTYIASTYKVVLKTN